jgi:uncharacterized protein involved in exopolysaccharide biosynthesis
MVLFFLGSMSLVVLGLMVFPKSYQSDARLFVRLGKESITLDPTATTSQTVGLSDTRESEINSEIEILNSRSLLEDVVDRVGAEAILGIGGSGGDDDGGSFFLFDAINGAKGMVSAWFHGDISLRERAIASLEKVRQVTSPRRSNVIIVKVHARGPELAQRILKSLLDAYTVRHLEANRTSGSYDFFVAQSDLLREQLETATRELRDAKNKNRLVSIEGQRGNVQSEVDSIESAMLVNQRALASADAKVAELKRSLDNLPSQLLDEQIEAPNHAGELMRNELYKVQILEKEASSRYTSEHPKVIALRRQVAETQAVYDSQASRSNSTTRRLSPVHQTVHTELLTAEATAASHRAEAESLSRQYAEVSSKIRALNDNEYHITELERSVEILETSYRNYTTSREQTRIDQALAAGQISNVNVVQPASLIGKPASPRVAITLLLGLVVSSAGAVLLAVAADRFDASLRTPDDVERELGIPVLLSVPRATRQELVQN